MFNNKTPTFGFLFVITSNKSQNMYHGHRKIGKPQGPQLSTANQPTTKPNQQSSLLLLLFFTTRHFLCYFSAFVPHNPLIVGLSSSSATVGVVVCDARHTLRLPPQLPPLDGRSVYGMPLLTVHTTRDRRPEQATKSVPIASPFIIKRPTLVKAFNFWRLQFRFILTRVPPPFTTHPRALPTPHWRMMLLPTLVSWCRSFRKRRTILMVKICRKWH